MDEEAPPTYDAVAAGLGGGTTAAGIVLTSVNGGVGRASPYLFLPLVYGISREQMLSPCTS